MSLDLFRSLHFKIASGVIGTVLILSAAYFVWDYRFYQKQLFEELEDSADDVSAVTLHSVLEMAMMGRHPELLQDSVQSLGTDTNVREIQILDASGKVHFASNPELLGKEYSLEEPGCANCHAGSPKPLSDSIFLTFGEVEILRHVKAIPNADQCHSCHDSQQSVLGALIVDFPTSPAREKMRANLSEMLLKAGTTVLATLLVLGLLLNKVVIGRIKRLTQATNLLADQEDPPDLDDLQGDDEIGRLATSFHSMSHSLRDYCKVLEEKEKVRLSLLERLVHTQEEERRKISRELHDQLGQSLSALLLDFQRHSPEIGERCEIPPEVAASLERRIRELIDEVHHLAWEMRPSILDDYGLNSALQRYIEEVAKNSQIQVDYQHLSPNGGRLPNWVEVTLYRVAQEAITNVIRHSSATRASVVLMEQASEVMLLVEDNGVGFNPPEVQSGSRGGLGLRGMQERVSLCHGKLAIESMPQKGTTIRVKIPLNGTHESLTG